MLQFYNPQIHVYFFLKNGAGDVNADTPEGNENGTKNPEVPAKGEKLFLLSAMIGKLLFYVE